MCLKADVWKLDGVAPLRQTLPVQTPPHCQPLTLHLHFTSNQLCNFKVTWSQNVKVTAF